MEKIKGPADAVDICNFLKPKNISKVINDIPAMYCSLGINPAADGSAYLEYDKIKVICSVIGPTEMKQDGQLLTCFKFAPFSSQIRRESIRNPEEKRLSQLLLSSIEPSIMLHTFPRGKYQIMVVVLDDGSSVSRKSCCLSAGITCASLALVHAGVQMYDIVIGLEVPVTKLGFSTSSSFTVAVMPQLMQITMVNAHGLSLAPSSTSSSYTVLRELIDKLIVERAGKLHSSLQFLLQLSMQDEVDIAL